MTIKASVWKGGANQVADVRVVQTLLNRHVGRLGLPALKVDGSCRTLTIAAIHRFQKMAGLSAPDSCVDPGGRTLAALSPRQAQVPAETLYADAPDGRPLTSGERRMLQTVFSNHIRFDEVRIFSRRWIWPFPKDRAMAPNGNIYFPDRYEPDFSAGSVGLPRKALFVHESTHLYQYYELGWSLIARGPLDRNYEYTLERGKRFRDYGLEQMGMIAQHYFTLRSGGTLPRGVDYSLRDYAPMLPVK